VSAADGGALAVELLEADALFAPVVWTPAGQLLGAYAIDRARIEQLAGLAGSVLFDVLPYFLDGNTDEHRGGLGISAARNLFDAKGAIAALNATYWRKALDLTDFYSLMPQKRRDEWSQQFRERKTPEFTEENLRSTLEALESSRMLFLSERVDGIFRALSGTHVTNSPAAFGNRMIIAHLVSSFGTTNDDRVGFINDLRCVIAKFMGRAEPTSWNASSHLVEFARKERRGLWVSVDGGALRLRAYNCGTAHLEVHPDMAWRLNAILAHLYPMAIPASFRTQPVRKAKQHTAISRPLPFCVISALQALEPAYRLEKSTDWRREYNRVPIRNALQFRYGVGIGEAVRAEVDRVLSYVGAVKDGTTYVFDFRPDDVLSEIICSGCLPDQKTHQFYPTPAWLAQRVVALDAVEPTHTCLEPSAGTGAIAELLPRERTRCVELSAVHAAVLEAKGYAVSCQDFLAYEGGEGFDRVVMNPPFSDGRAAEHITAAAGLLKPGGRLVAIAPAGMRGKQPVPGAVGEWSELIEGAFAGTSVAVAIFSMDRAA